ncbi:hypothetical protein ARSEF4850_006187, partial [Beauveria asiatica]
MHKSYTLAADDFGRFDICDVVAMLDLSIASLAP